MATGVIVAVLVILFFAIMMNRKRGRKVGNIVFLLVAVAILVFATALTAAEFGWWTLLIMPVVLFIGYIAR